MDECKPLMGGSNGGLLAGAMVAHYPQLFGAVVSQCPLLDMERFHTLTSGASWIDEYGDPKAGPYARLLFNST